MTASAAMIDENTSPVPHRSVPTLWAPEHPRLFALLADQIGHKVSLADSGDHHLVRPHFLDFFRHIRDPLYRPVAFLIHGIRENAGLCEIGRQNIRVLCSRFISRHMSSV